MRYATLKGFTNKEFTDKAFRRLTGVKRATIYKGGDYFEGSRKKH